MNKSIVVGLGFGDEGKGLMTSYLVSKSKNPLVIRFNGGHQAGHTVVINNNRHVFSNFGSGTLQNAPTYWSEFCTIDPLAILKEYETLMKNGFKPTLYIDPLCMVTTPYDIDNNRILENINKHGSCGVGFGQTIKRNEDYYKLFAMDLLFPSVLKEKLKNIKDYFYKNTPNNSSLDYNLYWSTIHDKFVDTCKKLTELKEIKFEKPKLYYDHLIFEGAQGILLDMDFGFFPNVTRSNTTSKNAITIIKDLGHTFDDVQLYYVSRVYQTRHGYGFMTNENYELNLINNENETNVFNKFQQYFRKGALDIDLLNYALMADETFSSGIKKNILFTCLDQIPTKTIPVSINNEIKFLNIEDIQKNLKINFNTSFISKGPSYSNIKILAQKHQNTYF